MTRRPAAHRSDDRSSVRLVRSSDGIVILDLAQDTYSCLYDPDANASDGGPRDAARLRWLLVDHGIGSGAVGPESPDATAWQDPHTAGVQVGARDVATFVVALARASRAFRRRGVADLLDHVRGLPVGRLPPGDQGDAATIAARFERLCLWLPFRIQCLFRSFFLLQYLRAYGLRADWIFGAALFPFEAHCWVADGSRLLAERGDRIIRFSILLRETAAA